MIQDTPGSEQRVPDPNGVRASVRTLGPTGPHTPAAEGSKVSRVPAARGLTHVRAIAAENLYWMGRHLERAEDTARLLRATAQTCLDTSSESCVGWEALPTVMGLDHLPRQTGAAEVTRLLIEDDSNPGAIIPSLRRGRENAFRSRDHLPPEVWEATESLSFDITRRGTDGWQEGALDEFLTTVIRQRHYVSGLMHETMHRNAAYQFVRIGEMLERADMTSRTLDLATAANPVGSDSAPLGNESLWQYILKALSAEQAYRQQVGARVEPQRVLTFLFDNDHFPRALRHVLTSLEARLSTLPDPSRPLRALRQAERLLKRQADAAHPETLHDLLDALQIRIAEMDNAIADRYFQGDANPNRADGS